MRIQRMPKKSPVRKKLTRREQRNLDIEISFIEGVVRRDPRYLEALQVLGDDYTRRGRYREGLKIDETLAGQYKYVREPAARPPGHLVGFASKQKPM